MTENASAPPAADHAYAVIKERIMRGEIDGGRLLSEAQIGAELGISRTPVHEAFLRLGAEHLLTLESRRGAFVNVMSAHEARDVLEMREAIEAASARRVIADGGLSSADVESLRANLAAQKAHLDDVEAYVHDDQEFHRSIVRASGNPLALRFVETLGDRQQRLRHQLFRINPGHLAVSIEDHGALFDALLALDADRYAVLLHAHVARHGGAL